MEQGDEGGRWGSEQQRAGERRQLGDTDRGATNRLEESGPVRGARGPEEKGQEVAALLLTSGR